MFRKTSLQSSIFDIEKLVPGVLPEDDWSFIYKKQILPLIDEEQFRHLYDAHIGRPNYSIRTMVSLLIFMGQETLGWREAEFQFARRIDWMIATNTPVDKALIDHSTLFDFYKRISDDEVVSRLFFRLRDEFMHICGTSAVKQRTDSFFIHGWLELLSRYGLFKETIRKFLQSLRKHNNYLYSEIKDELSKNYLDKSFDLTEKDKQLAHKRIALMAQDLLRIIKAFENNDQIKHYETFKVLQKIFTQQCDVQERDNDNPEIIIKKKPDSDTVCSPHNTDVRYVRKGKQRVTGNKGFISETCSKKNEVQFVTDVEVTDTTESDSEQLREIQDRLKESDCTPEKQYGDAGFTNGKTIIESSNNGIDLEGPSAGRSQSFEAYKSDERPLDAGDFDISFRESDEIHINKCPERQIPLAQKRSEKTGKINVHFDADVCRNCKNRKRCPVKIGVKIATFNVDEVNYVGAVRHHKYMEDSGYRKECATRAGVEGTVSEFTRAHGMRKSRHRNKEGTKLQMFFAAIGCNIKRFIRYTQNCGKLTPAFQ